MVLPLALHAYGDLRDGGNDSAMKQTITIRMPGGASRRVRTSTIRRYIVVEAYPGATVVIRCTDDLKVARKLVRESPGTRTTCIIVDLKAPGSPKQLAAVE